MKYTTTYHLPQWDETDRIMRTDFNQMCADMEKGLKKTASDAAGAAAKADAHAADAVTKAEAAHAAAKAAQTTANAAYSPSNLPYLIGVYTGTNAEQTVRVGFQPRFLIITYPASRDSYRYFLATGNGMDSERVKFTATGFTVYKDARDASSTVCAPTININATQYVYIAFR